MTIHHQMMTRRHQKSCHRSLANQSHRPSPKWWNRCLEQDVYLPSSQPVTQNLARPADQSTSIDQSTEQSTESDQSIEPNLINRRQILEPRRAVGRRRGGRGHPDGGLSARLRRLAHELRLRRRHHAGLSGDAWGRDRQGVFTFGKP